MIKAGTSDLGGHDFYGASVDIKVHISVLLASYLLIPHLIIVIVLLKRLEIVTVCMEAR